MHKQQGWPQAWEYVKQSDQTLGRASQGVNWSWSQCIKSHHAQTSSGKGYQALLKQKHRQKHLTWAKEKNWTVAQWSKVLFSDESKFCISFGNQGPRVWRKGGEALAQVAWSPVLSFHSLWWFGVQCHLLVLVHCVFWKPMSLHAFTKKYWSTSCFLLLTSFLKMLISFSSRIWHLPTLPKAPKVDWPVNSPDLNIENLWGIVKRKMRNETKNADELKATVKETWASTPPQQCHKLITSMPRRIEAVIKAKEPLPSIEYIYSKWIYFPEGQQFSKNVFFIGLMICILFNIIVKCEPKSSQLKEPKT